MDNQKIFNQRFLVALFNFLVIASIGTLLRYVFIHEVKIVEDYKNVLHAHSHIAMMGWVFMALFGSLLFAFTPETSNRKIYRVLFWSNQLNAMILIINFWIHGYDSISIILSSVYIIITYIFIWNIVRDLKMKSEHPNQFAKRLLQFALFFLFFSSLGILALAPVMSMLHGTQKVIWYYLLVQFYIHFNYNGWFIFGCLALFFSLKKNNSTENKITLAPTWWIAACAIATYCLSIFWGFPEYHLFLNISVGAAFVQLFFTIQLFRLNKTVVKEIWSELKSGVKLLFLISFSALLIKQLLQVIIIYPDMAHSAFVLRNYVIAYLHLTFLGVTTVFIFGYGWQKGALKIETAITKIFIAIIVSSIFIIELLLSIMGSLSWAELTIVPLFYQFVFVFSLAIVVSVLLLFLNIFLKKRMSSKNKKSEHL